MAFLPVAQKSPARQDGHMILCVFRSRLRPDADPSVVAALDRRLKATAAAIPGFVSVEGFRADDGDGLALIRFESLEAFEAWRHHPDHVAAKRRGHAEFFADFSVEVCAPFHRAGSA
jgi:heme-degrading monooxygenase HmoA